MSAWAAATHNSFVGMFLIGMQWTFHCFLMQIDYVGVSFGLWPRFVSVFFCCLFRFFRWRNASLAGGFAGRRFGVVVGSLFCFNRFADFKDRASWYRCFYCLLTRKDRAISATSAKLEEKKIGIPKGASSHLRLPSGPAGIRTTTGSLSALARPTPYQLSHRVASKSASCKGESPMFALPDSRLAVANPRWGFDVCLNPRAPSSMLDRSLNVAVSPFELIAIKNKFCLRSHPQIGIHFLVAIATHPQHWQWGRRGSVCGWPLWGPCKERWPYWVLKRCACSASTFTMDARSSSCRVANLLAQHVRAAAKFSDGWPLFWVQIWTPKWGPELDHIFIPSFRSLLGPRFGIQIWTQKWGQPSENFAAARRGFASRFATPAVAKSTPKAAKPGCAFSHSAERIVDELGLLYPENGGNLRKNMRAYSV